MAMAKAELIDERVLVSQCKLAINALHTHELKKEQQLQETELLPGKEPNIWLNISVKKIPSGHKFKPAKIPIAHPLIDPRTTPICLITKDPQREYKDLLETHKIKFISRVVGIEKLKGKFKPFEARRMLLKENGLFLADERIVPLLPKLLGVKWFEAKKQPIPVCLKRKDLKGELERAVSSTYMNQNRGTCTSVKIATLSQSPTQILANLKLALPAIAKQISGGWENVQALHIKTNSSISLPIWSCNLTEAEGSTPLPTEEPLPQTTEAVEPVAAADESPSKGKKRKRSEKVVEPPASVEETIVKSPSQDEPKQKRSGAPEEKKRKRSEKVVEPPAPVEETIIKTLSKDELKQKGSGAPGEKKRKKSEKVVEPPAPVEETIVKPLSQDELKQKRSGAPGEKKKSKVKSVGGKSAKGRVLARRAKLLHRGRFGAAIAFQSYEGKEAGSDSAWYNGVGDSPYLRYQERSVHPKRAKRLALRLPLDSFRFDFRGNHETPGTWRQGALEDDMVDLSVVVEYLKATYGYVIDLVVGHSRGSLIAMRWLCTTEDGRNVSGFVNASESPAAKVWKESFDEHGYHEWTVSVARKQVTVKIFPEDLEQFTKWDTTIVWDRFPSTVDALTIHGLADKTVPPYDAMIYTRALSNRSPGTHTLNFMEDADHNFTGRQDEVVGAILDWWAAREQGKLQTGIWVEREGLRGKL
ncbi:hypothetical protein D9615_003055 [Tricholomella constricta]|uniref:Ribosomal L1 domain-containing protein 1 n=1 Tax=Tricholomella constricta TaxID=117010 RepID=A0A8H5HG26_9AGAR|nr:hypothetical protein D9615_003055 [Tricholomella constricta]